MTAAHLQQSKVHNMLGQLFVFLLLKSPVLSCMFQPTESSSSNDHRYVREGEPCFCKCLPANPSVDSNITWFRNGSQTAISTDTQERIFQENGYLKIIPAKQDDNGFFTCVFQDAAGCQQYVIELNVFQNDDGLCYNSKTFYNDFNFPQSDSITIQCPDIWAYNIAEKSAKWYKDCKPLNLTGSRSKYYLSSTNELNVNNVTKEDLGNYTCEASLMHHGTEYKITRSMKTIIIAKPEALRSDIIYPTNNYVTVELGDPLILTCKVEKSGSGNTVVFWEYSDDERVIEGTNKVINADGKRFVYHNLTFLSVKEEDYNQKIVCVARPDDAPNSEAFVILKYPDPNFRGAVIAFFAVGAFLIITSLIVVKLFKVDIVLWYRSSLFSRPHLNDGKEYDSYIMYPKNAAGNRSYEMDLFVLKILPDVLETQCAYRLFIIGRDDLPGQEVQPCINMKCIFCGLCTWLILNTGQSASKDKLCMITEPKKDTSLSLPPDINVDLHCSAVIKEDIPVSELLFYWIINGNFTENYDKAQETNITITREGNLTHIKKSLHISDATPRFYHIPITCILQTTIGEDASTLYFTESEIGHWPIVIPAIITVFSILMIFAYVHYRTTRNAAH